MSRAVFTYKTKDEMRQMGLMALDSYIRRLRGMAKRGGPVGKSAAKELGVALKLRESLVTRIAVGDV